MIKKSPTECEPSTRLILPVLLCSLTLAACGSSSNDSSPLDAVELSLTFHSVKTFRFSWSDIADATHYKLLENPDGVSGFTQVGTGTWQGIERMDHLVPLYARTNAQYILQTCNSRGCIDSSVLTVAGAMAESIGYLKASNTDLEDCIGSCGDNFGGSVSLSDDGTTLAIGAPKEDGGAKGVNGNEKNQSARESGAVYVFTIHDGEWHQQAYIKASNTNNVENSTRLRPSDNFGSAVYLSADSKTLVVGAPEEDSAATGINGDQSDNSASRSGAVYVFTRNGDEWSQQAYIKASNAEIDVNQGDDEWGDFFGRSVGLSADGNTLVVGAPGEDSNATGINGNQSDNSAEFSGAAYVFVRARGAWRQQAYIKASNTYQFNYFGGSVSLSDNGNTLAVGAWGEWSDATGINGHGKQRDISTRESGAAYVFARSGDAWQQQAYIKATYVDSRDQFGKSISMSGDGNTLAVGAPDEDSDATGIDGNQNNNSAENAGAVFLFDRIGDQWHQQAYIKSSNSELVCDRFSQCFGDGFGGALHLSTDGNTLAVGAVGEDSNATGINGDQLNNALTGAGAVYLFTRESGFWNNLAYLKASNTDEFDSFGGAVSLSANADTLAVGASSEESSATGINGDQLDNSTYRAGAVYLF